MKSETFNYDFLISNGFKLVEKDKSDFFGDYFEIYSNDEIMIRFSNSKSFKTVDVGKVGDLNVWFDLALVKALIDDEKDLLKITTLDDYNLFLEKSLIQICNLFNKKNFVFTEQNIKLLGQLRVKQMFPNI
jgi:hypothetical protein